MSLRLTKFNSFQTLSHRASVIAKALCFKHDDNKSEKGAEVFENIFPSLNTLACLVGKSTRTVQRGLKELEQAGLINIVRRSKWKSNSWNLQVAKLEELGRQAIVIEENKRITEQIKAEERKTAYITNRIKEELSHRDKVDKMSYRSNSDKTHNVNKTGHSVASYMTKCRTIVKGILNNKNVNVSVDFFKNENEEKKNVVLKTYNTKQVNHLPSTIQSDSHNTISNQADVSTNLESTVDSKSHNIESKPIYNSANFANKVKDNLNNKTSIRKMKSDGSRGFGGDEDFINLRESVITRLNFLLNSKMIPEHIASRGLTDLTEDIAYHVRADKTHSSQPKLVNAAVKLMMAGTWSMPHGLRDERIAETRRLEAEAGKYKQEELKCRPGHLDYLVGRVEEMSGLEATNGVLNDIPEVDLSETFVEVVATEQKDTVISNLPASLQHYVDKRGSAGRLTHILSSIDFSESVTDGSLKQSITEVVTESASLELINKYTKIALYVDLLFVAIMSKSNSFCKDDFYEHIYQAAQLDYIPANKVIEQNVEGIMQQLMKQLELEGKIEMSAAERAELELVNEAKIVEINKINAAKIAEHDVSDEEAERRRARNAEIDKIIRREVG